ncbi:2-isopropylmalate synthase A-like [Iris pallida]|uniref:2-isopropylmalate synthase A-like n=1 Tax=Iris pallida TaxID=29817 RepID=A0AAX6FWM4_IRIPA|nr:2-isopropylmalate synthase A-like [Iris pallida]
MVKTKISVSKQKIMQKIHEELIQRAFHAQIMHTLLEFCHSLVVLAAGFSF